MPKEIKNTTSPQCVKNAVITGVYKDFTLKSMSDFVLMLRNRTLSELVNDFPRNFKMPIWNGNQSEMVKDMLAIDAIQWKLTGEYVKFLKSVFTKEDFIGEKALFQGFQIIGEDKKVIEIELIDNNLWICFINNEATTLSDNYFEDIPVKQIEDLIEYNLKLTDVAIKRIFR